MKELLLYGLQKSGTNYIERVLKKKFRVRFLNSDRDRRNPIQKHFRPYDQKTFVPHDLYLNDVFTHTFADFEDLLKRVPDFYLVISKDPYSWFLSYRRWGRKCEWPDVKHHYIEEYNHFYGKWMQFSQETEKVVFVRYSDLLSDSDAELGRIAERTELGVRRFSGLSPQCISKVPQSSLFTDERRDYYTQERYLEEISPEELVTINQIFDEDVMSFLGYSKR